MNRSAISIINDDVASKRGMPRSKIQGKQNKTPTVIIDESPLYRTALASILADSQFSVAASCSTVSQIPKKLMQGKRARLTLLSSDEDAKSVAEKISSLRSSGFFVILLVDRFDQQMLIAALRAQASGYLIKNDITGDLLIKSLALVISGGVTITNGFASQLDCKSSAEIKEINPNRQIESLIDARPLTRREAAILSLITKGESNKLIARELQITEATVKVHVKSLLRKIGVTNRTMAAMWARDQQQTGQ